VPEALRLALTTLTVLPVRAARSLDPRTAGRAMELAPVVGVVLWLLVGPLVFLVRYLGGGNFLAASLGIAALAVLTRGLHLDGLADLADGLGSYRNPEATRAVMKSPEVGPLGVVTLMLVLIVQVAAFEQVLVKHVGTASLLLAMLTARLAVTAACRATKAAGPEGMGALVAETVRRGVVGAWALAIAGSLAAWTTVDPDAVDSARVRVLSVLAAVAAGLLVARQLRRHAVRRVGGLTGDVLGALVEVTATVCLVVLAIGV
jgi:adenosylcobinamide-GDP ribazoletransferase